METEVKPEVKVEVKVEAERVETVLEAKRESRRFLVGTFVVAQMLAALLSGLYWLVTPSKDKFFHVIVIYGAVGVTIPMFFCTMRLMLKGYFLSLMGWESTSRMIEGYDNIQKKVGPIVENVEMVVDKAVPISETVAEIVSRSRGMAGDIEAIAHRIRGMMESMNGALDFKTIEGHLKEVKEHLATLASAFAFKGKKEGGDEEFPLELDVTKAGPRRARR